MKVFVLLLLLPFALVSQSEITPPELNFFNIEVEWFFVPSDSNFISDFDQSNITNYSCRIPRWVQAQSDDIYIFEQSRNLKGESDGLDLYSLDKTTGNINWVLLSDSSFTNNHYEVYNKHSAFELSKDFLTVYGHQSIQSIPDPLPPGFPNFSYTTSPIRRVIDLETGSITSVDVGSNTNIDFSNSYNVASIVDGNILNLPSGELAHIKRGIILEESLIKNVVDFYYINNLLTIDSSITNRITYNTEIQSQNLSLGSDLAIQVLNDSTYLIVDYIKSLPNPAFSPSKATLTYWEILSFDNITKIHEIDITEYFAKSEHIFNGFSIDTIEQNVILSQLVNDSNSNPFSYNRFSWLNWYDTNGDLLSRIEFIGDNNLNYGQVKPLFINEEKLYFAVNLVNETIMGYDVFSVTKGNNIPLFVGSLHTEVDGKHTTIDMGKSSRIDSSHVILPIYVTFELEEESSYSHFTYYLNINIEPIISTSTRFISNSHSGIDFNIFPNPASNCLTIKVPKDDSLIFVIRNSHGVKVQSQKSNGQQSQNISLAKLPEGHYVISVLNEHDQTVSSKIFFKI